MKGKNFTHHAKFIKKVGFVRRNTLEIIRNIHIEWNEHEDIHKGTEAEKYLRQNLNHKFKYETVTQAPKINQQRKILEVPFIAIMEPTLNNHLDTKNL